MKEFFREMLEMRKMMAVSTIAGVYVSLALLFVCVFMGITIPTDLGSSIMIIITALVLSYRTSHDWAFGSSKGSEDKTKMLANKGDSPVE